jgi:carboxynorspermidine decarboxylase
MMPDMDFSKIPAPCFVLDEALLRRNLEIIKRVQDESGAKIILALKGFALPAAMGLIRQYLPGTTASSLNEARFGRETFGGEVHAFAPVYLQSEMEVLKGIVSHITFNSLSQWERFKSDILDNHISAAIRINPEHSEVATDLYNPGIPGSRLGVPADELGGKLPDGIEGLHAHLLCDSGADALERVIASLESKFKPLLRQAKWLNLGGGHLIARKGYDTVLLIRMLRRLRDEYGLEVILEPGAGVVWETGVLVARIEDRVEHRGIRTLMLNVSFAAHMPDCLEMPYKPRVRGARDPKPGEAGWRLGGMTCLAGDYLGDYVFEQEPQVGDRIVLEDMMHYTMVKTTMFNGVAHPSIGIWRENGTFECVRSFSYEDYRSRIG